MSNRNDSIQALAEVIAKGLSVENNIISGDENVFIDNRPESLTKEQLTTAATYQQDFAAASGIATGMLAQTFFEEDAERKALSSSFITPLGIIDHIVDRNVEIDGEAHQFYLTTGISMQTTGASDVLGYAISTVAAFAPTDNTADLESEE